MMEAPLVSVCCLTYNHEKYLSQAIEGFLMQQTGFAIEIIIHDDASIDKTQDIIRHYKEKYPDLITPIFQKENQYSKGTSPSFTHVWPKARGKYIALCEGDDYWTDPLKLQKQVEYLESNPNCSMTAHSALVSLELNLSNEMIKPYHKNGIIPSHSLISRSIKSLPTASKVFRTDLVKVVPDWLKSAPVGDHYLVLLAITEGYVYYFDTSMSVYRRSANSWSGRVKKIDWFVDHHRKHMNSLNLFNIDTDGEFVDSVNDFKRLKDMELYQGVIKNGVLDSFKKRRKYLTENLKGKKAKFYFNITLYWLKKRIKNIFKK